MLRSRGRGGFIGIGWKGALNLSGGPCATASDKAERALDMMAQKLSPARYDE